MKPIILLTDFGISDPFVGIMKGVIARIDPQASVIDLTHGIPPGDIRRAAVELWRSIQYFPSGSIFVVVIDPGVGTDRHPILVESGDQLFIAPDNGVLSFILDDRWNAWTLTNPDYFLSNPGTTFHGRDLFSPVAAHASTGTSPKNFGDPLESLIQIPTEHLLVKSEHRYVGKTLHPDRFGNILTSLGAFVRTNNRQLQFRPWINDLPSFTCDSDSVKLILPNGSKLPYYQTFAEIPEGKCGVVLGSSGLVEIVANRQSAVNLLNLKEDTPITLEIKNIK